jgi:hypothetical protein
MTSIEELTGPHFDLRELAELCALQFGEVFGRRMEPLAASETLRLSA